MDAKAPDRVVKVLGPLLSNKIVLLLALLVIPFVLYIPGLSGPSILDDHSNLSVLTQYDSLNNNWQEIILENRSGPIGRPVSMASFLANYMLFGDNVYFYKLVNVLIHVLIGLLVFWFALLILEETAVEKKLVLSAFVAALLWVISPLFVSTTLYIVQRMAQLSCLFSLLSMISYVYARKYLDLKKYLNAGLLIFLSVAVFFVLSVFSKENGLLTIPLLLIIELFFLRSRGGEKISNNILMIYAVTFFVGILAAFFLVVKGAVPATDYSFREFTLYERLLTQARILWEYLIVFFIPNTVNLGVFHDDYIKSISLLNPITTMISVILWFFVFVFSIWSINKYKLRLLGFAFAFYLVGHSLESSIFSLELYFEHRNYLPMIGFLIGISGYIACHYDYWKRVNYVICIYIVAIYIINYQYVYMWGNKLLLLSHSVEGHPNSFRARTELANLYSHLGWVDEALEQLDYVNSISDKNQLAVSLHKIYILCVNNMKIPKKNYDIFDTKLVKQNVKFATTILKYLPGQIKNSKCNTTGIDDVSLNLYKWYKRNENEIESWAFIDVLSELLMVSGYYSLAHNELSILWNKDTTIVKVGVNLAYVLVAQGKYNEAYEVLQKAKASPYMNRSSKKIIHSIERKINEKYLSNNPL